MINQDCLEAIQSHLSLHLNVIKYIMMRIQYCLLNQILSKATLTFTFHSVHADHQLLIINLLPRSSHSKSNLKSNHPKSMRNMKVISMLKKNLRKRTNRLKSLFKRNLFPKISYSLLRTQLMISHFKSL